MSYIQIPNLPWAINLSGAEQLEIVQAGVSCQVSVSQIIKFAFGSSPAGVTQYQMRQWLATNGFPTKYIYIVNNACPTSITDIVNIRWLHGPNMVANDVLYIFMQNALGFNDSQMLSAYVQMLAIPILGIGSPVTQNQMRAWLANNGSPQYIYTVDNACSADLANTVNIMWLHGDRLAANDPLYNFIQSTLGFTSVQMQTAFIAMGSYPP
jgi:hypothetical protein